MSQYQTLLPDTEVMSGTRPRIVIAVDGLDKNGKDHFAFTAPKPLIVLDFDLGSEGVKGSKHPLVCKSKPFSFRPTEISFNMEDEDKAKREKALMEAAWPVYERFRSTYLSALEKPIIKGPSGSMKARTIVVNTGSEAWELMRYAELGAVTKVLPHHYTQVNASMRDLVRAGLESNVNVIWLHQLKAEWKETADGKARKSGTLDRAGFDRMANLVQANFLVYRVPKDGQQRPISWKWGEGGMLYTPTPREDDNDLGFRMVCGNSRLDPTLEGMEFQNDMIDFKTWAQMMVPDSTEADWADSL